MSHLIRATVNKGLFLPDTRATASMGLNTASVSGMNLLADDACVPLTSMIHDATAHLDVGQQRLNLTIPQAFMSNRARGYIPPGARIPVLMPAYSIIISAEIVYRIGLVVTAIMHI